MLVCKYMADPMSIYMTIFGALVGGPRSNFENIFGARKLESLCCRIVLFA